MVCALALLVAGALLAVDLLRSNPGPLLPTLESVDPAGATTAVDKRLVTTLPDGFEVRRLRRGEESPQFVLVSFDGGGWDDMWDYWFSVADRVPFRFTAFLSGTYLLSEDTRDAYDPPHYEPGASALAWYAASDLPVEIDNLNRALAEGDEIGSHFNGHFCASAGLPSGGDNWTTADWDQELDQFQHLVRDYRPDNALPRSAHLDLEVSDIAGTRTPCLEGRPDQLYPALKAHGIRYDSSFTHDGLQWPRRTPSGIWEIGMATWPVAGTLPDGRTGVPVTTMDYNYYFTQRGGTDADVDAASSARDGAQVLRTYRDLYRHALHGNRAPLVLGNHFNDWNNGAYRDALATFVQETCGRPGTECVTYSDLVAWLEAQRPSVLRELTGRGRSSG